MKCSIIRTNFPAHKNRQTRPSLIEFPTRKPYFIIFCGVLYIISGPAWNGPKMDLQWQKGVPIIPDRNAPSWSWEMRVDNAGLYYGKSGPGDRNVVTDNAFEYCLTNYLFRNKKTKKLVNLCTYFSTLLSYLIFFTQINFGHPIRVNSFIGSFLEIHK